MIQDLHAHTRYSFCGRDDPHAIIRAAIDGGVELFGISDHSYGVAHQRDYSYHPERDEWLSDYQRSLDSYLANLHLLRDRYADQITIKCGIEIPTANIPHILLPKEVDISGFDYCLLEHLDQDITTEPDLFALADRCGCPAVGVAHTDLPLFLDRQGIDKLAFFTEMAKRNIFWEMNVSYDSIHNYQEHKYVARLLEDPHLQELVRKSGLRLSVGFDGHRVEDYLPDRVRRHCQRLTELGLPLIFEQDENCTRKDGLI